VVFAVLAFVASALTFTPPPEAPATGRYAVSDVAVGTVARGVSSSIQHREDHTGVAVLVTVDPLRLDLIGHRGPNSTSSPLIRRGVLTGSFACERSVVGVAAARARVTGLSYSEVATTLARARLGAEAAQSTGPPAIFLL